MSPWTDPNRRSGRRPWRRVFRYRSRRTGDAPHPSLSPSSTRGPWAGCSSRGGQEIQKSDARAQRQQSTVPVGALHHHADLQAHRHYREFGVEPGRAVPLCRAVLIVASGVPHQTGGSRRHHLRSPRRARHGLYAADLGFSWSGRRDSNPRPSPWQGDCSRASYLHFYQFHAARSAFSVDRNRPLSTVVAHVACVFCAARNAESRTTCTTPTVPAPPTTQTLWKTSSRYLPKDGPINWTFGPCNGLSGLDTTPPENQDRHTPSRQPLMKYARTIRSPAGSSDSTERRATPRKLQGAQRCLARSHRG